MNTSAFEASDEVVNEAAASCARLLEKWFGGVDEAIAALEADPVDLADLAMRSHIKFQREMSLRVHMEDHKFARSVLHEIKHPHHLTDDYAAWSRA